MKAPIAGLITLLFCFFPSNASAQAAHGFAIRDVRLFDGVQTSEHRTVLVENGKIARVGGNGMRLEAATATINGTGMTLLPGLIDSHVRVGTPVRDALRDALTFGVTTELNMFTDADRLKEMKAIAAEDPPDVADVRSAGVGADVPGGHLTDLGGPQIPTISEPGEAQAFVDARIAEGSDYIEIIHDGRGGTPDTSVELLKALIDAAHKRGKLAVVHAVSENGAREAVTAGADGLMHIVGGKEASSDFGHFVARRHVFLVPSLVAVYRGCGKSTGPDAAHDPKIEPYLSSQQKKALATSGSDSGCAVAGDQALQELIEENAILLAGTDSPVPGTTYGASLHEELALYVHLGMATEDALAAATSKPARIFGLKDRGLIKPGMRADLLLVQGDPTTDIMATRNILAIWKRGVRFERKRAAD